VRWARQRSGGSDPGSKGGVTAVEHAQVDALYVGYVSGARGHASWCCRPQIFCACSRRHSRGRTRQGPAEEIVGELGAWRIAATTPEAAIGLWHKLAVCERDEIGAHVGGAR